MRFSGRASSFSFTDETYVNLYTSLEWWSIKKNLVGATLLFGYMRLFRYLELNARIKVLVYAMNNSMEDLVTTFFVLTTCIAAFAVCGMLLFGENLQEFSAIGFSISTLLRATIGDFACYEDLRYFHPALAPMYYAAYVFVVLLVVFNMLIAVVIDGYEEVSVFFSSFSFFFFVLFFRQNFHSHAFMLFLSLSFVVSFSVSFSVLCSLFSVLCSLSLRQRMSFSIKSSTAIERRS